MALSCTPLIGAALAVLCRMVQHVLAENQQTPYATVQNRAGMWVLPQQANFTNVEDELAFPTSLASPDWVNVILGKSRAPRHAVCQLFLACVVVCGPHWGRRQTLPPENLRHPESICADAHFWLLCCRERLCISPVRSGVHHREPEQPIHGYATSSQPALHKWQGMA